MHLEKLELIDVRSYQRAQLRLDLGVTVFVGPNAQGKTNIVEAVQRVSTGGSHRSAGDTVLVRVGAQNGAIRAQAIDDDGRTRTIDVALGSGRTQTKVDGHPVRRTLDSIGIIRTVLFAPEDLAIVRGDPSERRAFLDQLLAQRRPAYAAVRAEYERALRQRSQLLKQLRGLGPSARATAQATLDTWSEQLVHHGSQLLAARLAGVEALGPTVDAAYRRLADR
ncbi:MAG: DNA replication and repair protein RecF, partial [Nitriliruptoraceae bacterium]